VLTEFLFEQGQQEEVELTPEQVKGVASVLNSLNIDTSWLFVQTEDVKGPSFDIPSEAVESAKRFFELGKSAGNWYYDAHATLSSAFSSEQDMVLFVLILASTSVQNELYTNFVEAVVLYKRIKQDLEQRPELLKKLVGELTTKQLNFDQAEKQYTGQLSLFGPGITSKPSKYGNIIRVLKLLFDTGRLTKQQAITAVVNSTKTKNPEQLGEVQPEDMFTINKPFIGKLKIANYSLSLLDPAYASSDKNPFNVVVDTWMFRVFYPQFFKKGQPKQETMRVMHKLFSSQFHYNSVALTISKLAKEAGVSPHVMQAAIWTGIKMEWEGSSTNSTNYVSVINQIIETYQDTFEGMVEEAGKLAAIIKQITPEKGVEMLKARRKENFAKVSSTMSPKKRQFLAMMRKKQIAG
jgi:hypothetical protein